MENGRWKMIYRSGSVMGAIALVAGLVVLAGCASLQPRAQSGAAASRPNIIFILSDDVGLGDVSCTGGDKFKTPNIDALAAAGTRFERCYSTPLCGPSRAQILTGRYPFRTGMIGNGTGHVLKPANEIMIPRVLKPAGYVTAQVGKWNQLPLQPGDWGFDEYLRFPNSGRYWRQQTKTYTLNGQTKELAEGVYLPDLMHDFLIDFIKRHRDQPFYVHYAMSHIHGPIVRTPDSKRGNDLYADNIAYMDKLVGKLMAELDRMKLREKTLVIFVGDNGTARFGAARATVQGRAISGMKGTMLEGGSRVPMIVNWPGTTPSGKVLKDLVDFSDFYPTFAELAGAKMPEGVTIDGHSIVPQINGETGTPRQWVYVELMGRRYVRNDRWKLTGGGELFDLSEAPFKEIPVAADSSDAQAVAARKELQAVLDKLPGKSVAQAQSAPSETARARRRARRLARQQS
jgi:arylsulfatase A